MKKGLTFLLFVILLFNFLVLPTFAANAGNASAGNVFVAKGETATVTISISGCSSVKSGSVEIISDDDIEIQDGSWKISSTIMASFIVSKKKGTFTCKDDTSICGDIFSITLKASSSASEGDHTVGYTFTFRNNSGESFSTSGVLKIVIICPHKNKTLIGAKESTCTVKGWDAYYKCDNCDKLFASNGTTEISEIPYRSLAAHSYGNWTKKDATSHIRSCTCGDTQTENHTWDSGKITTQPTHTATGVKTYTCTKCSATKTETVSKLTDHSYGEWTKYSDTQHKASCVCGETKYENHTWDSGKITTQPTHMATGVKTYTCTKCGATKTETVSKLTEHVYGNWTKKDDNTHTRSCECGNTQTENHTWDNGKVTTAATHDKDGVKTFTCTKCGATKTEVIPKDKNAHTYGPWTKKDDNTHTRSCTCGDVQTENHTWDNGKITTQPTHTATGVKTYTCTLCGATKTETVSKLTEHIFGDWEISGNTATRRCVCGEVERKTVENKTVVPEKEIDDAGNSVVSTSVNVIASGASDGNAEVLIDEKALNKTLNDLGIGSSDSKVNEAIVLDLSSLSEDLGDNTITKVVLPFDSIKKIANGKNADGEEIKGFEIKLPESSISIDAKVLDKIIEMAGEDANIEFSIDSADGTELEEITESFNEEQQKSLETISENKEVLSAVVVSICEEMIHSFDGGEAVIGIKYDLGDMKIEGVRIIYIDENGEIEELIPKYENGELIFGTGHMSTFLITYDEYLAEHGYTEWDNPFSDISESDAYYNAIGFVYTNKLFIGISDTLFAPHKTMTRAMFVTVLGRLAGVDQTKYRGTSFDDVKVGEWYSAYVEWAAENGIVNGYGNGKFGVEDEVTIEQAVAIIARYARFTGIKTEAKALSGYEDISSIDSWAVADMEWAAKSDIYTGADGKLAPLDKAERALVATMICNFALKY